LTILSGIVAGNFSAFWKGMLIASLMAGAYFISLQEPGLGAMMGPHSSVFAFGLVAFGFLCMGPVNIAVDSYGPVTDNAQSIFELAQTEHIPGVHDQIERDFGFKPHFKVGKHYLNQTTRLATPSKPPRNPCLLAPPS
jgi:K(+)-stimulated pyrophosphate-energized sodium pump